MNNNAQPADFLASLTFFTVKNLTITCGSPAVPIIKAAVIKNTSRVDFEPDVYLLNPSSSCNPFNLSRRYTPSDPADPNPNCGIGFDVISMEIKIAGTMNANIKTQYCAT